MLIISAPKTTAEASPGNKTRTFKTIFYPWSS